MRINSVEAFPLHYPEPHDSNKSRYVTIARVTSTDGAVGARDPGDGDVATLVAVVGLGVVQRECFDGVDAHGAALYAVRSRCAPGGTLRANETT